MSTEELEKGLNRSSPGSSSPDANAFGWDGPQDPENPLNWPRMTRALHVVLISFMTLTVNLAATMFAPAAENLARDFAITDSTVASLTVSLYMLGFALGPLVVSPLSELYGRRWVYYVTNVCYLGFTFGCAWSSGIGAFLACRVLAGCVGSAPITIGGGTVADVIRPEKRGLAMSAFALGPLIGPVIGPIIGGFVSADLGWRWTFWIIAAMSGANTILCFALMRETYAPVLLAQRASRLSKKTGNNPQLLRAGGGGGSIPENESASLAQQLLRATTKATKMLFLSPILLALSIFNAFVFGLIFLLFTTFPTVFKDRYGFTTSTSGLVYLGIGMGTFFGLFIFSIFSDRIVKRETARSADGVMQPEMRLPLMMWLSPVLPAGFFWYGWCVEYRVHWMAPITGTSLIGMGMLVILVYVVDAFGAEGAASALAALAVIRALFGSFLPLAGPSLYNSLGYGWGNSLLGFIALVFTPIPIVFYRYGPQLRSHLAMKF